MGKFFEKLRTLNFAFYKDMTLEKKIMTLFTGSLAIFFVISGFIITSRITENNIKNVEIATRAELTARDNAILAIERSVKGKIKILSKDINLIGEPSDVANALKTFAKDNDEFSQVFYGRNDGEFVETPKNARENAFDPRNTVWYKDAVGAGENNMMIVTAPFQGLDGQAKVGFYSVVNFYGYPNGVVGGTINFSQLVKMSGEAKNTIILDNDDNIVFDSENTGNLFQKLNKDNTDNLSLVGQKNEGVSKVALKNKNMLAIVYKSETTKLKYIKLIDYNEATSSANTSKYIIIVAFVGMLIISFGLSKLLYKDIKKSFMNIEAQTEAIGEGKLDAALNVAETADEVGRLSFAFGKMAGNVKSRLMTMETESQNLRALIKEMSDKNELNKEALESLSDNLNNIIKSFEIKLSNLTNISDKTETLKSDFAEITNLQNKGKDDIITLVQNADLALKRIKEEKANNETEFKRKKEELDADFKEKSKNLTNALQKIADDASEISLMAFSAALEAARGKDEKSKFAKIAEDIRKLADSMSKSASAGLKSVDNFAPQTLENAAVDMETEMSTILTLASGIKESLNSAQIISARLEEANTAANAAAKESLTLENDSKYALDDALNLAKDANNNVGQIDIIAQRAFK